MKFWDSGGSPKPRKICHLCYSALLLRCLTIDLKGTWICFAVTLDESRRINEDGSWNKYNARKNGHKGEENA